MAKITWPNLANDRLNGALQTGPGTALTNSTSETIVSQSNQDIVLNANELYPGKIMRVRATGEFTTPGSPGTLRLRLRYGGTGGVALLDTTALTPIATATSAPFWLDAMLTFRTEGTTGTVMAFGLVYGLTNANSVLLLPTSAPAVSTVDTTAAKSLALTAQWGTLSASYSLTVHQFPVEELN
jgi:hypothetical protein